MSDKYIKNEMDREMILNIQIQKQVLSVLPQMNVSKQFISPTTQDMIDDYKKQFKKPGFKFQMPGYEPELETVEDLEEVFTDTVLAGKMKELEDFTNEFTEINNVIIPKIEDDIRINRDKYNKLSSFDAPNAFKLSKELRELGIQRRDTVQRLAELRGFIDTLNQDIQGNNIKKESNIAKITSATQNNQQKIKDYNNTLKLLNFNNIDISQQPGESEEDFLNRLTALGLIEDEDPTNAILFNINEFKKNMKTIIKQEWMIENILKILTEDDVYLLNMQFTGFKKLFVDLYGINNQYLDLDNYLTFISEFLNTNTVPIQNDDDDTRSDSTTRTYRSAKSAKSAKSYESSSSYQSSLRSDRLSRYGSVKEEPEDKIEYGSNPVVYQEEPPEVENASSSVEMDPETLKKIEDFKEEQAKEYYKISKKQLEKDLNFKKPLPESTPVPKAKTEPLQDTPIQKPTLPDFKNTTVSVNGDKIVFTNKNNQNQIYLRPYVDNELKYKESISYSYNDSDYTKILRDVSSSKMKELNKNLEGDDKIKPFATTFRTILTKVIGVDDTSLFMNAIKRKSGDKRPNFMSLYNLLTNEIQKSQGGSGIKKQKKKPTVHKGKSLKDVPSHCEFGKLILLLNKLYHKNMLSVKDKNNVNVQGIPNTKVSNNFVNLLMKICTNKKINKKDINNLNQKEMILYNVLISKAGLSKDYDTDIKNTIKTLKNRLQLIEGQIVAGNNNDDLKKELYDVIFKLSNIGAIAISSARKYYNETLKLYFKK
jgi:hypothetical protein